MIFREFPKKLKIESEDDGTVEITVMFVSKKLYNEGQVEIFVAVGYDSDNNIHEAILNQSKIIEIEPYGSKIRTSGNTRRKVRTSGEKVGVGDNHPSDEKVDETQE